MLLKKQYEIENGELQEYFDVDLVSNDGLLQKYLNDNNDVRLKSIVSTIQKNQNEVIRKNLSDNIIVQGVAGFGKRKNDIDNFKCSMKYKAMLDQFLSVYFQSITAKPLILGDF